MHNFPFSTLLQASLEYGCEVWNADEYYFLGASRSSAKSDRLVTSVYTTCTQLPNFATQSDCKNLTALLYIFHFEAYHIAYLVYTIIVEVFTFRTIGGTC